MKRYHLSVEEPENSYQIIAIYTNEQDYRLAFLLNQYLNLQLKKSSSILNKTKKTNFTVFEYEDATLFQNWILLTNYCYVNSKITTNSFDLFKDKPTLFKKKIYYLKKYKKASFLLKLVADKDSEYFNNLIQTLQQIPQIYAADMLFLDKIKNKKLLIF